MGTLVTQTTIDEAKGSFTVATVASSLITVPATGVALFVGSGVGHRQMQAHSRIEQCMEQLDPSHAAAVTQASCVITGGQSDVVLAAGVAPTDPTEDAVAVLYGEDFPYPGSSEFLNSSIHGLRAVWMERVAKIS